MSGETTFLTLGIETSCDETSVSVLRGEYDVLVNSVYSQAVSYTHLTLPTTPYV